MQGIQLHGLHAAIKRSFVRWSREHPKYSEMFSRISEDTLAIAFDAIDEMTLHKPGMMEVWWATNHNRYVRRPKITQKETQLLFEIFYNYLGAFARGELSGDGGDNEDSEREEAPAPRKKIRGRR
jgi:hypothetical protein